MFSEARKEQLYRNACNIITQGGTATRDGLSPTSCRYKGMNNTHCALGWSMTDWEDEEIEQYEGTIPDVSEYDDATGNYSKPNRLAKALGADCAEDVTFLLDLQRCHDPFNEFPRSEMPLLFAGALIAFGRRYNLDHYIVNEKLEEYKAANK